MKREILRLITLLSFLLVFIACKDDDGDNWTPTETVTLGDVSIKVPETYQHEHTPTDTKIDLSNNFDGGSLSIYKEAVAGRTPEDIFTYKTNVTYPSYVDGSYITSSDTILLSHNTRRIDLTIPFAASVGANHYLKAFIFIDGDYVYTVEFGWSEENYDKSLQLMNDMLATMQIK